MLLYVILSGCSPFSADEEDAILQLVAEAKYEFHDAEWTGISDDAKDLCASCPPSALHRPEGCMRSTTACS